MKKQHRYIIRSGQFTSAIFCPVHDFEHVIDFSNASILMYAKDYRERNIIESAVIKQCLGKNRNFSLGLYSLDSLSIIRVL